MTGTDPLTRLAVGAQTSTVSDDAAQILQADFSSALAYDTKLKVDMSFATTTLPCVRQGDEPPRARLWRRAARQRGYFTAAQALEAGYSYQSQRFHVQRGNWIRIDRGIYRFREFLDLPPEEHEHLVRWMLWSRGRAVVSHETALGVHDLGIANPTEIHLTVPPGFRQQDPAVVVHAAGLASDEVEEHEGFRVTTPIRAIAESAADGADQDVIDSAVIELLDRGLGTRRQLLQAAQAMGPQAELALERALRVEGA